MTTYNIRPDTVDGSQTFRQNTGQDPARYLVPDSELFHKRPSLMSGDLVFVWPVGTEGVRNSGQATLATHHYFGDDDVEVQVIHRDESRIEMSGTLPGLTGVPNMQALRIVIRDIPPDAGKVLFLPGIFERVQFVVVENYDFQHSADDRTHSWDYTISFIRTGTGRRIPDPHGKPAPPNPVRRVVPKGKPARVAVVRAGVQTLRQISRSVYGDERKWTALVDANQQLNPDAAIPYYQLPNYRWPLGTRIYY